MRFDTCLTSLLQIFHINPGVVTERLLQFIWQFQYFNSRELICCTGERIEIVETGQYNQDQGPDFTNARIRINGTVWAGTIELHIKTSDWQRHHHQQDPNYRNVILHVVWENDSKNLNDIPVLELQHRVSKLLLGRYEELMHANSFIACGNCISQVPDLCWAGWKERLLAERLLRKAGVAFNFLKENNFHWEEAFWWLLARTFGMKVNADAFEAIARSIPLKLLARQKNRIHRLEALLLGQAGLLNGQFKDSYPTLLQREYAFLVSSHHLRPAPIPVHFLRMRPGNFPTVRLAQLAMLIHESAHLFSRIREATTVSEVRKWFEVTANDYWHYHYRFDEASTFKKKRLGDQLVANLVINTIVPMLFAYGDYYHEPAYTIKAVEWLEQIPAEQHMVTEGFEKLGVTCKTAYDSQACIELKSSYCDQKRCLECAIGNSLLKI